MTLLLVTINRIMPHLYLTRNFVTGLYIALFNGCSPTAYQPGNFIYQYKLIALEPLERYDSNGISGSRGQDIPVGDTIVAESSSLFTGVPAYSKVIYKQREVWVFGALSKTAIASKKKIPPVGRRLLDEQHKNVIYR